MFRVSTLLISTALLACASSGLTQRPDLLPYHQLRLEEFRIDDEAQPVNAEAATGSVIEYHFLFKVTKREGKFSASVSQLRAEALFDPEQSWRRSNLQDGDDWVLNHEQGHMDLAQVRAMEIDSLPLDTLPSAEAKTLENAKKVLSARLKEWMAAQNKLTESRQELYDRETGHGTREAQQLAWTKRIREELVKLQS